MKLKILRPKQSFRIVYDFGPANWNDLQDYFLNKPWNTAFFPDMNDVWIHGKLCFWRQSNVRFQPSRLSIKGMYHGLILN